jgi:hypothetical protein
MSDEERPVEANAWVNVVLIIIGLVLLAGGLLFLPPSISEKLIPAQVRQMVEQHQQITRDVAGLLGLTQAVQYIVYGLFAIIAGIGLFRRRAWAWGMGIMMLSIIVVMVASGVVVSAKQGSFKLLTMALPMIGGLIALIGWPALFKARKAYTA